MKFFLTISLASLCVACGTKEVAWDATGTFEATQITVSAQGNGEIEWLSLYDGQQLDSAQVVGIIDTIQLSLKKAQLVASRSGAMSRRADIAKQIASIEQQIAWQSEELKRYQALVKNSAATQKQVDDISNQISVLNRELVAQRSTLENTNRSITDDGRAIEVQIAQNQDMLSKCYITSPIKGTVLVRLMEAAEYATTGKPIFEIADMNDMYIRAYITANQLTQMKLGQSVKVYSDFGAESQRQYDGVVQWISSRAEFTPKTIQTRDERANLVYAVKISVRNDGYLKIGMYGQVVI